MGTESQKTLPKLIAVLGPTATGKSDFAVEIARACKTLATRKKVAMNFEIISADSRQVYTGLDIGSGKITKKEMRGIPHFGLNIVSPKRKNLFTASQFQEYAIKAAEEIISRGNIPILCGGTGFYIQAVVDGIVFPDVPQNLPLREKLDTYSKERLQKMLLKLDSKRYEEVDKNNPYRLKRAIEIAKALGEVPPIKSEARFDVLQIGLDTGDEILKEKIEKRIHTRIKKGMIGEAQKLHKQGVTWKRMKRFGLEYGLLADLLQKKLTKEEFVVRLAFDIKHYVRRQRAWFRRDQRIIWIDPTKKSGYALGLRKVKEFLKK